MAIDPAIGTDTNGRPQSRSQYFTPANRWVDYPYNWVIRAGVGQSISGADKPNPAVAHQFRLMDNYPNPFNPETTIPFELAASGDASLSIYNLMGQKVTTLVTGYQPAGYHVVQWRGRDHSGQQVASGLYLVRLEADHRTATRKIALIR